MKFRTDFVTNSSDSSFLTFNIKNKRLYQYLEELGIHFETENEGELADFITITLPSGKKSAIEGGDNWFYPTPGDFNSISAWLVGSILWEIEDIYPQKEEDEYSDFSKELIRILNDADITHLDWEMVKDWSRDDLYLDLGNTFDQYDGDMEEAFIEYTYGFEGEVGPNYVVEVKNGLKTTYSLEDIEDEEDQTIEDLRFVLVGKFENFETREEFKEYIEDQGGIVSSTVSKNTHFVICNDEESTSKSIEKAKELCIPIISENAFVYKFARDDFDCIEYEEFEDDLWDTSYFGGFKFVASEYGVGKTTFEIWKKGKWVNK